ADQRDALRIAPLVRAHLGLDARSNTLDSVNYDGRLRDNYDVRSTGVIVAVSWL
ncbi:MAG: hypothetical protein QOG58_3862, partial [Caballeronia sp.]|nr:hypothetical protein [Caballeronia sp.]